MQKTSTTSPSQAIEDLIQPWIRACVDRDWDALLAMCTEDIVFMPPGDSLVTGAGVRPWLESFPVVKDMSWRIDRMEDMGDVALLRGPVRQILEIDGRDEEFDGKYFDVMRRTPDGTWRFDLIIWNRNDV